jgi:hypothetical protein
MAEKNSGVISHWHQLFEDWQESPKQIYKLIEAAIKKRELPETYMAGVNFWEGGALSARREYLRVCRNEHVFDICVAPFGKGMFISWWLSKAQSSKGIWIAIAILSFMILSLGFLMLEFSFFVGLLLWILLVFFSFIILSFLIHDGTIMIEDTILEIPVIGAIYDRFFHPRTYYKMDTALMFQESIRRAVLEVIDEMTKSKGLRALSESERKPIMNDLFK